MDALREFVIFAVILAGRWSEEGNRRKTVV